MLQMKRPSLFFKIFLDVNDTVAVLVEMVRVKAPTENFRRRSVSFVFAYYFAFLKLINIIIATQIIVSSRTVGLFSLKFVYPLVFFPIYIY
jgi:hypothetical protein